MQAIARAKTVRMSAKKARLVADQIRGKRVPDALQLLSLSTKRAALPIRKVLASAVANAEERGSVDSDALRVSKVMIDGGPQLKRWRPRAYGRATQVIRRTCHITIELSDGEQ